MISNNAAKYSGRGAHRLNAWGALVTMVVRSAGLRSYGEDRSIGVRRPIPEWPMAADVCLVKCARTLTHLQNINLWTTAARVESKRTATYSPGLSLCSRSIGPRLVEEVYLSPFVKDVALWPFGNTPAMLCRYPSSQCLQVCGYTSIRSK